MKVQVNIVSKFGKRMYGGLPLLRVESYQVDSAMDTDTDQFSVDVGDPEFELISLLSRDDEVRVSLSAQIRGTTHVPILQGYADTVAIRQDGSLSLQGRDLSSAAVDTTAVPFNWRNARPTKIIGDHARKLGFSKLNISPVKVIRSLFTDGSESEWDFWYRMVRKRQMWIWCSPDGTLNVDQLNYAASPTYYFGVPGGKYQNQGNWIRVEQCEIRKNTQTRIGEVWVFGETGKVGFGPIKASDPNIKDWIKKPLRIITADAAHTNRTEAIKEANEEIFEGIVGSIEIAIRISDPGMPIRQNTTAILNLPQLNFSGEFFVVGTQIFGGQDGFYQSVRLREKKYALTRRIPKDPTSKAGGEDDAGFVMGSKLIPSKADYGEFFIKAAQAWHGGWDYDLFLATLLAIGAHESAGFQNVREGNVGGPEWSPPPDEGLKAKDSPSDQHHHGDPATGGRLAAWRADFANDPGNPLNPFGRDAGVGIMQLTTHSYKEAADKRTGIVDEYVGGRWHPEANIFIGASVLASKLQKYPQTEANFWLGVRDYNGKGAAAEKYAKDRRNEVNTTWLPNVRAAEAASQNLPANSTKTIKDMKNAPVAVRKMINYAERQLGDPYRLGSSGPDNFDCSGLVWAAYNAAGLSADIGGRQNTWGYWANGKGWGNLNLVVEKTDLLPGDMVFFDNFAETPPGHVGLYYGDGQMIVAPHTGDVVKIESISVPGLAYMGGMRLKGVWPHAAGSHPIGSGW